MISVLDTHAIVWFLQNDARLGKAASFLLEDPKARFAVPTLVLCELSHLSRKAKLNHSFPKILDFLKADRRFEILSLDEAVIPFLSHQLDIHDDVILATALALEKARGVAVSLVTCDKEIKALEKVATIWE